jgi:manganese/zinc/iron transport system permease protein
LDLVTGIAAVAAFEAVGSILVIAMFISPPCTARMLTDRLSTQIWLTVLVAFSSGIIGYLLAAFGPGLAGGPHALNAAGMVAAWSPGLFRS